MGILSLGVVWFVLLLCHTPCVIEGLGPSFLPEDNFFGDCDDSSFKPFKNKCLMVITDSSMDWEAKMDACDGMPVYIESDEERQFYFDKLLRGREKYLLQLVEVIAPETFSTIFPDVDTAYLESQTIGNEGTYHPSNMTLECLIGKNDIKQCLEFDMDDPKNDMAVACGVPRPLFQGVAHECKMELRKKFRRDATRTIKMNNDKADICYLRIKTRRHKRPSMVKIYSQSFPRTRSCIPGFFITANTDLVVSDSSLPPLRCGDNNGLGHPLYKKKSGPGGEIRLYFVMSGDGTPLYIRTKGRAYVL